MRSKYFILCALSIFPLVGILAKADSSLPSKRCDDCNPGEPLEKGAYPAAYNAPAAITLKHGVFCESSLFFDASFLYWHAQEEGLELASSAGFTTNGIAFQSSPTSNGELLLLNDSYQPGFKVGFGADIEEWALYTEYTWIRQTSSVDEHAPATDIGTAIWVSSNWFEHLSNENQSISATNIQGKWNLGMDLVDLNLGRPFYQGTHLTVLPFSGLRGAWIRQKLSIALTEIAGTVDNLPIQPIHSHNSSNSWGIGPRIGFDAYFLMPQGFRLESRLATSILYTTYTSVKHTENSADALTLPTILGASRFNDSFLRAILETGLGFGWEKYFSCQRYHIDFSATYDFSFYFKQNMMRKLMDEFVNGISAAANDLEIHGLTLTGRFDF